MTEETEDHPISKCIMLLFEDMKGNRAEIEGLKKMMGKVAKGMDDLTKRIATLEQLV
ncbi:hypothetical protein LCGC14_1451150 [marine sediment metagenome]|uniref:Uncharacterized protein n=1 Tax=marine sediment metagenome TaxID=412755 RepID=A0A0F9MJM9_9ZZZZ